MAMAMELDASYIPHDELMSRPGKACARLERATAPYKNHSGRFVLQQGAAYDRQYAQIYFQRLMLMRHRVLERAQKQWPDVRVAKILNMPEGEDVVVVGTIYKDMKLKPSILDEYTKDRMAGGAILPAPGSKLTGEHDSVVLEDESARMTLRGALPVGELVTGVVLAVRGSAVPGGDFHVTGVCYAGIAPQPALPPPAPAGAGPQPRYVALLSGLGVGDGGGDPLRLSLVVDYLTGALASGDEQKQAASVVRAVIAGGLMRGSEALSQAGTHAKPQQQAAALAPIKAVDMCLTELACTIPVDIMPGPHDPSTHSLPQQPLHRCLLPGAAGLPTLQRTTNPYDFEVGGVRFLGTAGQNVDDLYQYSVLEDRLQLMERCMEWGHLVPTAPDTLTAYPFADTDPFVIESAPHVLFAGNQPAFQTRQLRGPEGQAVRLVAVPRFDATGVLVLLDLATLDVEPIYFDASFDA